MEIQSPAPTLTDEQVKHLNTLAVEVDLETIIIGPRVRRDFSHVPDLSRSMSEVGLIQPIVLTHDRTLIAGESRIRAAKSLGWKTIRAVFRGILDEAELLVLEATENNARKNLTWQERCLSVDRLHRIHSTNAALSGRRWGLRESGELLKQGKSQLQVLVFIAEFLHKNDQEIWAAETIQDALRVVTRRQEDAANAAIARLTIPTKVGYTPPEGVGTKPSLAVQSLPDDDFIEAGPSGPSFALGITAPDATDEVPGGRPTRFVVPLSTMLLKEDNENTINRIREIPSGSIDHCITDWPYAIDMDYLNANNIHGGMAGLDSVRKEHDVDLNLQLQRTIVPEIYRVLKDRSFFITWMDVMHWNPVVDLLESVGFKVQRWPLVWLKTSSCMNQSAQSNFTKNFEIAVVARKGTANLVKPQQSSVWTGGNDEAKALGHPFAKPFGLWDFIYDAVCIRGQHILEPFAGRGSALVPAIRRGLRFTAIESNLEHYNALVVNVSNVYRAVDPKVEFS